MLETVDILLMVDWLQRVSLPINTITGYQVNGLTSYTDNTITVIGYKTGKTPKNDSIVIHPYISPPSITILHPEIDEIYYTSSVEVNWSINSENSGGLSALWIESDTIPKTQISASLTKYTLNYLETGYHWVNITAVGVNGLISSANHSFYVDMESPQVWITSGQAELGSTEYTVKWGALNVEYINITVNGEVNASYLPANSPTGYLITNLIDDIDYEIQVIGYKTGFSEAIDSINIHTICSSTTSNYLNPLGQYFIWILKALHGNFL
jgi:hypothetical protein